MIFEEAPANFNSSKEVSAVYVLCDEKLLLLKRSLNKKVEPGKWGVPAGSLEKKEEPIDAAVRELCEETGIVKEKNDLEFVRSLYVRYPGFDFIFHIFKLNVDSLLDVKLNSESMDSNWVELDSVIEYELVMDELGCIKYLAN